MSCHEVPNSISFSSVQTVQRIFNMQSRPAQQRLVGLHSARPHYLAWRRVPQPVYTQRGLCAFSIGCVNAEIKCAETCSLPQQQNFLNTYRPLSVKIFSLFFVSSFATLNFPLPLSPPHLSVSLHPSVYRIVELFFFLSFSLAFNFSSLSTLSLTLSLSTN